MPGWGSVAIRPRPGPRAGNSPPRPRGRARRGPAIGQPDREILGAADGLQAAIESLRGETDEQDDDVIRIGGDLSSADLESIEKHIRDADLVVGGVLIPGAAAPKLVSRRQLSLMKPGAVVVDVAIDQGGCFETSRPTTHAEPTYVVDGIVHYCVANMPGAVPRTSTFALNNVTLPFTLQLADKGAKQAMLDNPHLLNGLNVHAGKLTYFAVGEALGLDVLSPNLALKAA